MLSYSVSERRRESCGQRHSIPSAKRPEIHFMSLMSAAWRLTVSSTAQMVRDHPMVLPAPSRISKLRSEKRRLIPAIHVRTV